MTNAKQLSRRDFLRWGAGASLGLLLSACGLDRTASPPTAPTNTRPLGTTPPSTATRTPVIVPTPTLSACMARASFGDPAESPYVLPYPVGKSYRVSQSYCFPEGGHRNQLAYDFRMPIGDDVTAARAGVVRDLRDETPDRGALEDNGLHNYVLIEHADGTTAFYAHLKQYGIVVQVGEYVEIGQWIADSGNSGLTVHPHLHFGVYASYPVVDGRDVPVNFRNTEGRLDARGGLIEWVFYRALPYDPEEMSE